MATRREEPIEAVVFDLDGVLVSTDEHHYRSWKRLADEEGIPFDREVNRGCLGLSRSESLEVVLRNAPRSYSPREKAELAERKNRYFLELVAHLSPRDLAPGAQHMLRALKRRGVKVAVASGSRNAPLILERLGVKRLLDACVSGQDITHSKPHPESLLLAAERLGVSPRRCLVVEDAPAGVEAAQKAGMRVLGVGARALAGARRTVASLADISVNEMLAL